MAIVVIYVNDTLVIAPWLETVLKVKKQIGQRWKMEDSGEVSHFLGIKIRYIDQVLAKHLDKRTKPTMVPMQSIPEGTLVASAAQQKEYPVIVGKLLWVANSTRPDLSLTVGVLARHMHKPSQEHYQAAQQVLRYLESTKQVGVRGLAPETQVGLSRYSVTIKLCDSYCLGISLGELIARRLSSCAMTAGGVCCICYRRFRLTSVDTPFRGGSARSISIGRLW
ncbi:uncharacterized protein UDID_18265 [Ustilago sp. UG-2017a]|nr:uncharacterized protein UDID_18265 [Ustilago sp. UG-2017a]